MMIKTPEEMLKLVKKMDRKTPWSYDGEDNFFEVVDIDRLTLCDTEDDDIGEFIAASGEFVPYAAEWIIDMKKLLQDDILILLKQNMENDYVYVNEHLDAIHKIEQFLKAKNER